MLNNPGLNLTGFLPKQPWVKWPGRPTNLFTSQDTAQQVAVAAVLARTAHAQQALGQGGTPAQQSTGSLLSTAQQRIDATRGHLGEMLLSRLNVVSLTT